MKKTNQWVRAGFNGILCAAFTLLLTAIAAKLIESGTLPIKGMEIAAYGILGLSCFAGCLITSLTADRLRLAVVMLTGSVYALLLCIANGVLQRGEFRRLLPTLLTVFGTALLAGLLGAGKRGTRYRDYDKGAFAK